MYDLVILVSAEMCVACKCWLWCTLKQKRVRKNEFEQEWKLPITRHYISDSVTCRCFCVNLNLSLSCVCISHHAVFAHLWNSIYLLNIWKNKPAVLFPALNFCIVFFNWMDWFHTIEVWFCSNPFYCIPKCRHSTLCMNWTVSVDQLNHEIQFNGLALLKVVSEGKVWHYHLWCQVLPVCQSKAILTQQCKTAGLPQPTRI